MIAEATIISGGIKTQARPILRQNVVKVEVESSEEIEEKICKLNEKFGDLLCALKSTLKDLEVTPVIEHLRNYEYNYLPIEDLKECGDFNALLTKLAGYYDFLNCKILITITKRFAPALCRKFQEHLQAAKKFRISHSVKEFRNALHSIFEPYFENVANAPQAVIKLQSAWDKSSFDKLEILIKGFFPNIDHIALTKHITITCFSVHITYFMTETPKQIQKIKAEARHKILLMKYMGIFELIIDKEVIVQEYKDESYTIESAMIEAAKDGITEAVEFFLQIGVGSSHISEAITAASENSHQIITKLLLAKEAKSSSADFDQKQKEEFEKVQVDVSKLIDHFEAHQGKKKERKLIKKPRRPKGNSFLLLSQWKERETDAKADVKQKLTAKNSTQEASENYQPEDQVILETYGDFKQYEASKSCDTLLKLNELVVSAIESQDQLRVAVNFKRKLVHTKLLTSRLHAEGTNFDVKELELLNPLVPQLPQNLGVETILQYHKDSIAPAVINDGNTEDEESELDEKSLVEKKRKEFDEKRKIIEQSTKDTIDEAQKMTSGTTTEIKRLGLIEKIAEFSQGTYQSKFVAEINAQLIPHNSSSNLPAACNRIAQNVDYSGLL